MMTRETARTWAAVQAATLALGVTDDPFVWRVLCVYMESDSLDELRAELAFVDDPDVLAWYRALGVD